MRFARRAGKRDTLEAEVIKIARSKGWIVMQLDQFDLLCHRKGWTLMVEVKSGNKLLTASQLKILDDGFPLKVVKTLEDAEELFT